MSGTELAASPINRFGAVMTVDDAVSRWQMMVDFTTRVMRAGVDFGVIPGTDKPTLLKPGAEKLCTLFGLVPRFEIVREIEEWNGDAMFYYLYRCSLYRNGELIAEGDASANSREKKHRYRNAERVCPDCGKATLRKSKEKAGYYCWAKLGGCGNTFAADCEAITNQVVGLIPNPDVFDLVNTLQKMAQKRALVAATLIGVNASEFYTQDMEDFADHSAPSQEQEAQEPRTARTTAPRTDDEEVKAAAVREATERASAAAAKLAQERSAAQKLRKAAFLAMADERGLGDCSEERLAALLRFLSGKEKPEKPDVDAALQAHVGIWNEAIDNVNQYFAPKKTETTAPTEAEANATVEAMSQ